MNSAQHLSLRCLRFCRAPGFLGFPGESGFTLVELTALVLALTFLTFLVLPVLVQAKERTRQVTCQSNLRQLGFAMQGYADANAGWLPGPAALLAKAGYDQNSTHELAWFLAQRLGCPVPGTNRAVVPYLMCPAHPVSLAPGNPLAANSADYVLNDRLSAALPFGRTGSNLLAAVNLNVIASRSEWPAMADADKGNVNPVLTDWSSLPYSPVHGKIRNQLYFDWHVADKSW